MQRQEGEANHDEMLRQELQASIEEQLDDACQVRVFVCGDSAWLLGHVSSELAVLLAEDLVFEHDSIETCLNELEVVRPSDRVAA